MFEVLIWSAEHGSFIKPEKPRSPIDWAGYMVVMVGKNTLYLCRDEDADAVVEVLSDLSRA